MAFDNHVAIYRPLHYMIIMSRTRCNFLVLAAWAGGAVHAFPQFSMIIQLPFCGPNEINHYFYDISPLLKVACHYAYQFRNGGLNDMCGFIFSYVIILFTLRNHSAEGRWKALSICGSHITVVILFFAASLFTYLRPCSSFPEDKVFVLFYSIIAPMFNLLIYTLGKLCEISLVSNIIAKHFY